MAGYNQQDITAIFECCIQVGDRLDLIGQRDARQIEPILAIMNQGGDFIRRMSPEPDSAACTAQLQSQCGPPGAAAKDCNRGIAGTQCWRAAASPSAASACWAAACC